MGNVLVLGYGVSGKASAALLKAKGFTVIAVDKNPMENVFLDRPDFPLDTISLIIRSPGIALSHPILQRAIASSIEIIGEVELAFRFLENRAIGITGTNGKTTVTLLVEHVLNASGIKARAVGNIGVALSEYLLAPDLNEVLVIELSSFQLESLHEKKLLASVYLNLTPDHLDRYATMRDYAAAKANIQNCSHKLFVSNQVAMEFADLLKPGFELFERAARRNPSPSGLGRASYQSICGKELAAPFRSGESPSFQEGVLQYNTKETIAPISWLEYIQLGAPERQNVQAAECLCAEFGIGRELFLKALKQFKKPHHRIEWIGEVGGVHYINDSKGTNIDAVIHAIDLFKGPVVLIAGGVDKGASYRPWIEKFQGIVKKIIAYGQAASKMEAELAPFFSFQKVDRFNEAFDAASDAAAPGDCVLLSPGCSSFDQFLNYEYRGDAFKNKFKSLQQESIR